MKKHLFTPVFIILMCSLSAQSLSPNHGSTSGCSSTLNHTGLISGLLSSVTCGGISIPHVNLPNGILPSIAATVTISAATSATYPTTDCEGFLAGLVSIGTCPFTYDPPTIISINPSTCSASGGTSVTITGTNFCGITGMLGVTVGGIQASVVSATQTSITITTPPCSTGPQTVAVTVTGDVGSQSVSVGLGLNVQAVLGTELTDFTVSKQGKSHILAWKTADEKDLDRFIVERSANGKDFMFLGNVESKGQSNETYIYADNTPLSINYYRLRLAEKNGELSYSKVVSAMATSGSKNLTLFPNPVGAEGYLNVAAQSDIHNTLITNILGQVVLTSTSSNINVSQLAKGMYHITVKTEDETLTEKFLKQ